MLLYQCNSQLLLLFIVSTLISSCPKATIIALLHNFISQCVRSDEIKVLWLNHRRVHRRPQITQVFS